MSINEASLKPIISKLESLFSIFNEKLYNNELPQPVITVSPDMTKGAYGWCTSWKAWTTEEGAAANEGGFYEINLCAEHLARPFIQTVGTLLHEMVHLFNLQNGTKDTSRGGTYHNAKFRTAAEAHGLTVEATDKYGWSRTKPNTDTAAYIEAMQDKKFELHRTSIQKPKGKTKQSTRKYVCPGCGCIIRATKEVRVACCDCDEIFEEETA